MRHQVLAIVATKAKAVGLLTAAVVTGAVTAGVVSSAAASGTVVSPQSNTHQAKPTPHAHESDPPDAADDQGVHGKCVSKIARDKSAVGGPHHNHGGAVSAAAHSCPHGPAD